VRSTHRDKQGRAIVANAAAMELASMQRGDERRCRLVTFEPHFAFRKSGDGEHKTATDSEKQAYPESNKS
jgi:hypothetical protein